MSVEMLLIDEHSMVVQGSIPAARQLTFRRRLTEGSVYTLSEFDVTCNSSKFKLFDGPFSIRFNDGTAFEKIETPFKIIPTEYFRSGPYEQLLELATPANNSLVFISNVSIDVGFLISRVNVISYDNISDVIGELRATRSTITDRIPGAQRVMLTLRLERDVNVCVSMFDSLALAFHTKLDGYRKEPRIVLVTAINPKMVSGGGTDQSGSSPKVVHAQKIEPLTVAEINQYFITGDPQIIEFFCTAKVTEVQLSEGWCYIGCSGCSKKLVCEETSFTCVSCNETNAVAELRKLKYSLLYHTYRVVLSASDDTGTAALVGFDKEVAKLTHVIVSAAAQLVEGVEVPEPAVPQTVELGSDAIGAITRNVAEQATTSDGPLARRETGGEEQVDLEESVPKKARV
ncbi:hypothetical protein Bca52824_027594 [Brassica carinata]|uniref:Replication factor A C-terminal domain-containing protein n=1 Tax=Brassica carinata TaxID=52824 RepID=A0A8X7VAS5_BRACI|nr:hypothetical protein Bca52824_027594 [Brassica carinata]